MPHVWRELDDFDAASTSDIPLGERLAYWERILKLRRAWLDVAQKNYFEAQEQVRLIDKEITWRKDNKLFPEQKLRGPTEPPRGDTPTTTSFANAPGSSTTTES